MMYSRVMAALLCSALFTVVGCAGRDGPDISLAEEAA
jgi:hypothetical protein